MIIILSVTRVTYVSDGTQTTFSFPFDYLRKAFVTVSVNNVDLTYGADYTVNNKEVLLAVAKALNTKIIVERKTSTEALVGWHDASVLTAKDMTVSQVQQLHILEEQNTYIQVNGISAENKVWQGQGYRMSNIADPTEQQDAVTLAYVTTTETGLLTKLSTATTEHLKSLLDIFTTYTESLKNNFDRYTNSLLTDFTGYTQHLLSDINTYKADLLTLFNSYKTTLTEYVETAKRHMDNAKISETNAKLSETNSKQSETNSKTSETNSKTSETASKLSETNSKASETVAKTSETHAKASETESATRASKASVSETNSKTSETNAKTSETNAKTSETNAKTSETNAKTSEVNALDSATRAETAFGNSDFKNYYNKTETNTKLDTLVTLNTSQNVVGKKTFSSVNELVQVLKDGTSITFNTSLGHIATLTVTQACTISVVSVSGDTLTLMLTNGGSKVITWQAIKWTEGTAPELTATGIDVITLININGTLYGTYAGGFA